MSIWNKGNPIFFFKVEKKRKLSYSHLSLKNANTKCSVNIIMIVRLIYWRFFLLKKIILEGGVLPWKLIWICKSYLINDNRITCISVKYTLQGCVLQKNLQQSCEFFQSHNMQNVYRYITICIKKMLILESMFYLDQVWKQLVAY